MSKGDRFNRRRFLQRAGGAAGLSFAPGLSDLFAAGQAPRGGDYQIGCYTRPWDQYEYLTAFDAVAEAGFKYLGLMTAKSKTNLVISVATTPQEAEKIGREAKDRGLRILSVYGGDIPVAESLEAGIAGMKRLIDNCSACDAKNLMMGGTGDAALNDRYYKAVAETCDYAAEKHIGISVKPHGGLNATGPQCRKIVETVAKKNFGIWYDPGNIFYYSDGKLDPVDDAATVDGIVVGVSVKDYRHPKEVMLTPGTGQVNFAKVLARLRQGGFRKGPLIVECLARGKEAAEITAEARKARTFLEAQVASLVT